MKAVRFGSYSIRSTAADIAMRRTALEIDIAEGALVTAAAEADGDATQIVAAAGGALALGQRLDRLALVELAAVDDHQLAQAGGDRFECLQSHRITSSTAQRPVVTSMVWPSSRVTTAFFTSDRWPRMPRNIFTLPLVTSVLTLFTLTSNSFSTAALICGFVAVRAHLEDDLVLLGQGRGLLGDDRAHDHVVVARVQAHLKRASSASTAAFVRTSFSRRRMS